MLELKTSTVEKRESIKKRILNTDLIIPLSKASSTQNTGKWHSEPCNTEETSGYII
jgi:hypothetical protein